MTRMRQTCFHQCRSIHFKIFKNAKSVHNTSYIFTFAHKTICKHTVFSIKLSKQQVIYISDFLSQEGFNRK